MSESIKRYFKIGDKLKKIRMGRELNQTEFSKILGITRSTYSNYENNNRVPDENTLNKISSVLDIPLNDLLGISSARSEFEEDFDIKVFDEEVMQYVLKLKKALRKNLSGDNITNTTILQNLVINRMANDKALKETGMYTPKIWLEFTADRNGNLLTGKELESMLKQNYISEYLNRKKDELIIRVQLLIGGTHYGDDELIEIKNANIDELKNIKKFYYDAYSTYEHEIPDHIKYLLEFDE